MAGTTSVESILKQIIHCGQETQRLCLAHSSVSPSLRSFAPQSCSPQQLIADISLPDPPSMQPALLAVGARPEISLAMDQVYQKRADDLRATYHSALTLVCSNQAQYPSKLRFVPEQKILSAFSELYVRELIAWRQDCVDFYLKRSSTSDNAQTSRGAPRFNHVRLMFCLHLSSLV